MPDGEMNNELVALAIARMAELRAGIEQWSKKLERFETYLAVHQELCDALAGVDQLSKAETALAFSKKGERLSKAAPRTSLSGIRQVDFVPFVRDMILEYGRPMNKKQIYDGFKRKGRCIGGRPEFELKNLGKKLARAKKKVKRIGGAGYWPIDVPCPEVGYIPLRPVIAACA